MPATMQIQLNKNIYHDVREVSRFMGVDEEELIERALMVYLKSIDQMFSLRKELSAWDALSDEAFVSMEKATSSVIPAPDCRQAGKRES